MRDVKCESGSSSGTESDERYYSDDESPSASCSDDQEKLSHPSHWPSIVGADCLLYRGEGNSSLVIALKEEGKVLRILKHENDKLMEKSEVKEKLLKNICFCERIIRKLMNQALFEVPIIVTLNKEQVNSINLIVQKFRPSASSHRRNKFVPESDTFAILMNDYCSLPKTVTSGYQVVGPVISVEIKPKQGFISTIESQLKYDQVKPKYCRYSLAQCWKLQNGTIHRKSDYCPLDLFSGCRMRMRLAIQNLIRDPQNNFRIFNNLNLVYGEDLNAKFSSLLAVFVDSVANDEEVLTDLLIQALLKPFNNFGKERIPLNSFDNSKEAHFCENHDKVKCPLSDSIESGHGLPYNSVLETILAVQKLDSINCNTALDYIMRLQEANVEATQELNNLQIPLGLGYECKQKFESNLQYMHRKVWEYLVSMTAKDCSILITMQRLSQLSTNFTETTAAHRNNHVIQDRLNSVNYLISVSVTDLDQKAPERIFKAHQNELFAASLLNG